MPVDKGTDETETRRSRELLAAQDKAAALFARIAASGCIRPGVSKLELVHEVARLGRDEFGLVQNWHKRIVRAGPNTLAPYADDPPNLVLGADDICFIDLGPVFEAWEADFGRTYVLGSDARKLKLRDDAASAFSAGKYYFETHPEITGAELYACIERLAQQAGWTFGGHIAAHLVGEFPHKTLIPENRAVGYADPRHHTPMRGLDSRGRQRHWIWRSISPTRWRGSGLSTRTC